MTWTALLGQLPVTLLLLAIVAAGAWLMLQLGMRVERDQVHREIRAGRLIVVPDDTDLERLLRPYVMDRPDGWGFQ